MSYDYYIVSYEYKQADLRKILKHRITEGLSRLKAEGYNRIILWLLDENNLIWYVLIISWEW